MSKAYKTFAHFEENGEKALKLLRKKAFTPSEKKVLRTWGIVDAAKMIQRTPQAIREAEKDKKIPLPPIDENTNRKVYSLSHINKLREYFKTKPKKPEGKFPCILAVINFKGGVWKTSESVDLSQYLALQGYKVLLIDCDSQGSTTQAFGYIPDSEIDQNNTLLPYFLEENQADIASIILKTHWDGLDIIPANLTLYEAEFYIPIYKTEADMKGIHYTIYDKISNALSSDIKQKYDFIIMDCPPSMGIISTNAIFAANSILIPTPPSMFDFSSTVQFFSMVKSIIEKLPEKDFHFIRLLITKHEKTENAMKLVALIRQLFGDHVLLSMIPYSEAVKKGATEMRSIYELDKYAGSKKTLDRIKMVIDEFGSEIVYLAEKAWGTKG